MERHPFRLAVEAGDLDAMTAQLAADVRFNSPIAHRPYDGRELVGMVLEAVFEVFQDFRYTDELPGDVHGLIFRATVDGREIEGIDLLRCREDGLIADFTVMVRPLSAATALKDAMAAKLATKMERFKV